MIKLAEFHLHPKPWGVYQFPWGTAIKHEPTQKWHKVFIGFGEKDNEVDVSGIDVILHENGIEFLE